MQIWYNIWVKRRIIKKDQDKKINFFYEISQFSYPHFGGSSQNENKIGKNIRVWGVIEM